MRIWSQYQTNIFDAIQNSRDSLVIEAVAGSGKTSTLVEALNRIPAAETCLFLAFNRHIAAELQTRVPRHVQVKTCHAFGLAQLFGSLQPKPQIEERKSRKLLDDQLGQHHPLASVVAQACSLAKNYCVREEDDILSLIERHDLDVPKGFDPARIAREAAALLYGSFTRLDIIDFDDMIWLPTCLPACSIRQFSTVLVDEAQDLNRAQQELVAAAVRPGGRVVAVGDSRQAIYGFRGADTCSMATLQQRFGARRLPLSISYRCPRTVVQVARGLVPTIEAAPGAPDGEVVEAPADRVAEQVRPDDMVLCRTMRPLIALFFELVRSGQKAAVRGRDLAAGLVRLIQRFSQNGSTRLPTLLQDLDRHLERETARLTRLDRAGELLSLQDRIETIAVLAAESRTVPDLLALINRIFQDDAAGVQLSTIHRAKGLEARSVWLLRPDLIPHPMARQPWEQQQEQNLAYVAVTRSLDRLTFCGTTPAWAAGALPPEDPAPVPEQPAPADQEVPCEPEA